MARLTKERLEELRNEEDFRVLTGHPTFLSSVFDTIDALEQEIAAWKTAVYSLTPGGSEFVADPKRCAVYIRERTNYPKLIVDLRAEIADAKRQGAEEMRERAAMLVDFRAFKGNGGPITPDSVVKRGEISEAIRALPLDAEPPAESRGQGTTTIPGNPWGVSMKEPPAAPGKESE